MPRYVTLRFPDFRLDLDELAAAGHARAPALLVLNTPHNPTGKVLHRGPSWRGSPRLCQEHDLVVVADEVYEHLTFDDARHVPIASLPGMRERVADPVVSTGKTFSFTGWKIGWVTGPAHLVAAAQAAHQFLTFAAAPAPGGRRPRARRASGTPTSPRCGRELEARRDLLVRVLREAGFEVSVPQGHLLRGRRLRPRSSPATTGRSSATWSTTAGWPPSRRASSTAPPPTKGAGWSASPSASGSRRCPRPPSGSGSSLPDGGEDAPPRSDRTRDHVRTAGTPTRQPLHGGGVRRLRHRQRTTHAVEEPGLGLPRQPGDAL